jgi:hypothetical protein
LVLFRAEEIDAIHIVRRDMIDARGAARLLGLPLRALAALAEAGMIRRVDGPALALVTDRIHFRLGTLHNLLAATEQACRAASDDSWQRLGAALRLLPPGEKPWVALVQALLGGRLPAKADAGRNGLFARLLVPMGQLSALVETLTAGTGGLTAVLSYREAAAVIGLSIPNVSWLVAAGLITTTGEHSRRITSASLIRFNDEYVATREIARHLGIQPSQVRKCLSIKGIEPVYALRDGMRLIWRRGDVFGDCNRCEL